MAFRKIAEQLGISTSWAGELAQEALAEYGHAAEHHTAEYKALNLARTETALQSIWPKVLAGNLGAVEHARRMIETQGKILGYNAPVKIAPTDPTGAEEWTGGGLASLLRDGE